MSAPRRLRGNSFQQGFWWGRWGAATRDPMAAQITFRGNTRLSPSPSLEWKCLNTDILEKAIKGRPNLTILASRVALSPASLLWNLHSRCWSELIGEFSESCGEVRNINICASIPVSTARMGAKSLSAAFEWPLICPSVSSMLAEGGKYVSRIMRILVGHLMI
jgi:hypothetical protein